MSPGLRQDLRPRRTGLRARAEIRHQRQLRADVGLGVKTGAPQFELCLAADAVCFPGLTGSGPGQLNLFQSTSRSQPTAPTSMCPTRRISNRQNESTAAISPHGAVRDPATDNAPTSLDASVSGTATDFSTWPIHTRTTASRSSIPAACFRGSGRQFGFPAARGHRHRVNRRRVRFGLLSGRLRPVEQVDRGSQSSPDQQGSM